MDQEEFLIFLHSPPGARSQHLARLGFLAPASLPAAPSMWDHLFLIDRRCGRRAAHVAPLPNPTPRPLAFGETIPTQPRPGSLNKRRGRKICTPYASPVCSPTYTLRPLPPSPSSSASPSSRLRLRSTRTGARAPSIQRFRVRFGD